MKKSTLKKTAFTVAAGAALFAPAILGSITTSGSQIVSAATSDNGVSDDVPRNADGSIDWDAVGQQGANQADSNLAKYDKEHNTAGTGNYEDSQEYNDHTAGSSTDSTATATDQTPSSTSTTGTTTTTPTETTSTDTATTQPDVSYATSDNVGDYVTLSYSTHDINYYSNGSLYSSVAMSDEGIAYTLERLSDKTPIDPTDPTSWKNGATKDDNTAAASTGSETSTTTENPESTKPAETTGTDTTTPTDTSSTTTSTPTNTDTTDTTTNTGSDVEYNADGSIKSSPADPNTSTGVFVKNDGTDAGTTSTTGDTSDTNSQTGDTKSSTTSKDKDATAKKTNAESGATKGTDTKATAKTLAAKAGTTTTAAIAKTADNSAAKASAAAMPTTGDNMNVALSAAGVGLIAAMGALFGLKRRRA